MIELKDDRGMILIVDSENNADHEVLTLRFSNREEGANFNINLRTRIQLAQYFEDNGVFLPKVAKWLKDEGKEIISVEHLQTLLDAANFSVQTMYKQRDNIVAAINKIEPVFEIYKRLKENNNED